MWHDANMCMIDLTTYDCLAGWRSSIVISKTTLRASIVSIALLIILLISLVVVSTYVCLKKRHNNICQYLSLQLVKRAGVKLRL